MATHFPALEDFEETPVGQPGATPIDLGIDGDTDFLAREQEILGVEASRFVTPNDGNLLGGGDPDPTSEFKSNFPEMNMFDNNDMMGPGGVITGTSEPYLPGQNTYSGLSIQHTEEEPEVIKQWRERQALEIQRRDEQSEARKRETIEKAQGAVDDFYENYNAKRDKAIEQTRREAQEFLDARENMTSGGTAWERIAKLVDLTEKGARSGKNDKTRFREMLLSLKKDEKAPGASGF